jgi:hypothetical protein
VLTVIPVAVQAIWRAVQRRTCRRDGHAWQPCRTGYRCTRCAAELGALPDPLPADVSGW